MHKINPNILLKISKDGLRAFITLYKGDDNDSNQDNYMIDEIIKKIKEIIKVGLDEDKLRSILLNKYYNNSICIAEGILPLHGEDGYIKYYFDTDKKLVPKVLEDGTVDYRELNFVESVRKGDVLAELIPPKDGKVGYKVTGEEIPFKKGKCPRLRYGKNVRLLDNQTTLVAEKDGLVKLDDGKVLVLDLLEVDNVDKKVGNINFNGSVIVRGNVYNGFKVKADGDVEIKGIIEGAYIENTGNLMVRQGIQGYNKLTVNTKGSVTAKFIENAIVVSGRNVTAEAIMHSNISSKDRINLIGKKGLIVGGVCRAGVEISAKTIGSSMATSTVLEVGVDPEIKKKCEYLKNKINNYKENLDKIIKSLNLLDKLKRANRLDEKKEEMYIKLLKTKDKIVIELDELNEEYLKIQGEIENSSMGRIKVSDTIYPGVKITIGDSTMFIRNEMSRCTFYRDGGEIKIGPY